MLFSSLRSVGLAALGCAAALAGQVSLSAQTFFEDVRLTASDAAQLDGFGQAVDMDGDTLVVGANTADGAEGAAYVFVRNGCCWSEQAKLTASGGEGNLGTVLALSGDTLLVGAFRVVYVFVRGPGGWSEQARLTASQGDPLFGGSVALEGDTAVVGMFEEFAAPPLGAVYVYTRSGTTWSEQARLVGSDSEPTDNFGVSVAISDDTLLVGSSSDSIAGRDQYEGSAYVFVRSGSSWSEQAKLVASERSEGDLFGFSVDLDDDVAAIGARQSNPGRIGAAYVFRRAGSIWSQEQRLQPSDGQISDEFGFSVSIRGDLLAVGAWRANRIGAPPGAAYVFWKDGNSWSELSRLFASQSSSHDLFGVDVVTDGDRVFVGAPGANAPGAPAAGAAYLFVDTLAPNLTAVEPVEIEALIPGTAQTIQLRGRYLDLSTALTLDGALIDPARYTLVSPTLVTLDMPQVAALGMHQLAVSDGSSTDGIVVNVVAPALPRYEMASGEPLVSVDRDEGLRLRFGGLPGHTHLVVVSTSNLPSTNALVDLDLGDHFTNIILGQQRLIPAAAWIELALPPSCLRNPSLIGLPLYSQTIDPTFPAPLAVSNLQSLVLVP